MVTRQLFPQTSSSPETNPWSRAHLATTRPPHTHGLGYSTDRAPSRRWSGASGNSPPKKSVATPEKFLSKPTNTDETAQADEIWVTANLPPQIRHALNLPSSDDGDDGLFGSGFADQLPRLLFKSVAKSGFVNYVWSYRKNNSNKCEKGMKPARNHFFQKPKPESLARNSFSPGKRALSHLAEV